MTTTTTTTTNKIEQVWRAAITEQMMGRLSREAYEKASKKWGFDPASDADIRLADQRIWACLLINPSNEAADEDLGQILASTLTGTAPSPWDAIYTAAAVSTDPDFVAAVAFTENRRIGLGYALMDGAGELDDNWNALEADRRKVLQTSPAAWLREAVADR